MDKKNEEITKIHWFYSFITLVVSYTVIGLFAGILYSILVKDLNIPSLSLANFLAIWYIWACLWVPPVFMLGSMFFGRDLSNKI